MNEHSSLACWKTKCLEPSPSSSSVRLPPAGKSCQLFSHHCQLYPCQPVYQYTSFIKKENDQTLRKRNPTVDQGPLKAANSSKLEELFTAIEEKKHHQNRRQLAVTVRNQHHLTNRHIFMERSMANLDEQSRQLHQRLTDRKSFGYVKERQHGLRQALQRHLEISAKFCAATWSRRKTDKRRERIFICSSVKHLRIPLDCRRLCCFCLSTRTRPSHFSWCPHQASYHNSTYSRNTSGRHQRSPKKTRHSRSTYHECKVIFDRMIASIVQVDFRTLNCDRTLASDDVS